MGYVDKVLLPDERVLYRAHLHWIGYIKAALWMVAATLSLLLANIRPQIGEFQTSAEGWLVIAVILFVFGSIAWLMAWIHRVTTEVALTTRRVIYKEGL